MLVDTFRTRGFRRSFVASVLAFAALARAQTTVSSPEKEPSCGAASLWVLAEAEGRNIPKQQAIAFLGDAGHETSMLEIKQAASKVGLTLVGRHLNYEDLSNQPDPCIVQFGWQHFVVVLSANATRVVFTDGFDREIVTSREVFEKQWSGYALVVDNDTKAYLAAAAIVLLGLVCHIFLIRGCIRAKATQKAASPQLSA